MTSLNILPEYSFLNGTSKAVEIIRSLNWKQTTLGDPGNWPQSLKSALSICLNSNFPIAIYWGPALVLLYNDAWSPIPGIKHPWALGKPAKEVWPEIWDAIYPQFEKAFSGEAGGSKDALLPMQRHGYTEECYFDFTFTPIYGESGNVEGIFNAVIETTYRVINERRSFLLQRLTDTINAATKNEEVYAKTAGVLENAKEDIPFFSIFKFDEYGNPLVCSTSPEIEGLSVRWPFEDALAGKLIHLVDLSKVLTEIPSVFWPEPPTEGILVPLKAINGQVFGCIAAGVSSRRKYDTEYKSFFESLASIIGGELNTISSLEEQRKKAETLADVDKAKTIFFSNISHEFRTPLTLMLGPLETVIESGENSPEQRENLDIAFRNSLRLQKLVNTLLDFSRIEAGRMEARLDKVNIGELTQDLASSFRSAIEGAGITYSVKVDSIDEPIILDIEMWEKIVLNLLSNALKFTHTGGIKVVLKDEGNELSLEVHDTGVGIRQEEQPKIFDRFYRATESGSRSQEGTGIGLSMVKELVSLLKGIIHVKSEPGKGSTFTVTIPKTLDTDLIAAPTSQMINNNSLVRSFVQETMNWGGLTKNDSETISPNANKGKILVADDNGDMRRYIHRLLSSEYQVKEAINGEDAFHTTLAWQPDLILSDIMMPEVDGFELLKRLKTTFATRNIPLIFLSARAGEEAKIEGINAGADDYLVKPFAARELLARVANHILISKTRRQAEKEFFNLFLQSPAHIHVMKGPEHVVEFFHPLGKPFIGGKDITGMKISEAVPEVAGQGYFEMLDQVYNEGKSFFLSDSKASLTGPDGNSHDYFFNITYLPWRGLDGEIQGVLQFSFDVSEQAKSNQKIKESEERFRSLVTSIPQIVWVADNNSNIEYLSEQWQKYTGLDTTEGRKRFSSLIHIDDIDEVRSRWYNAVKNGIPWQAEYRLKNEVTNTFTWFSGYTIPLKDEKGNIIKWIGSSSDISAQKQLNDKLSGLVEERTIELIELNKSLEQKNHELSKAQNFLQTVLDSSIEMVTAFDQNLNFTFVNKKALDFSNTSLPERIGKNIKEAYPGIENADVYEHLVRALKGEIVHVEARKPFSVSNAILETFVLPLSHNKEITGVLVLQRDVTAMTNLTNDLKKANSDLQRSNEDLQQFAHVTSHDLKEPVRKIRTFAEMLRRTVANSLPEKGLTYLKKIDHATSRISNMIDGILQYSSIEMFEQVAEQVDLNLLITGILEDLEVLISEKKAKIYISEMPVVNGSYVLLNQLFYNLINNALKFSATERIPEIRITSSIISHAQLEHLGIILHGEKYIRIDIIDNGIGFEQIYGDRIFEPFARLNAKDKFEGTGLGLALCKKIVDRHKGFIKATGVASEGAVFSIFMPE